MNILSSLECMESHNQVNLYQLFLNSKNFGPNSKIVESVGENFGKHEFQRIISLTYINEIT